MILQTCFSSSIDKTRVEQNTLQCFASFYSLTKKSDFSPITVTHSSGHKICMFERWQLWPVKEFNFHQIADNDPLLTAIQRWLDNQLFANFQRKPTLFTRYQISKPIMVSHFDTFTQIKIPLQSSKIVASKEKEKLNLFTNAVLLKAFTIYTLVLNLTKESKGKKS